MNSINVVRKIYANGKVEDVDEKMTLEQVQKFVGGLIEYTDSTIPHRSLIVNEEGLMLDLPINLNASKLLRHPEAAINGKLSGDALLVKS